MAALAQLRNTTPMARIAIYPYQVYVYPSMKTTLNIDDHVMERLRHEAIRQGTTMSELVETALRRLLTRKSVVEALPPLPSFNAGLATVDISNREALYTLLGES